MTGLSRGSRGSPRKMAGARLVAGKCGYSVAIY
jgi:hypothetical protein